MIKSKVKKSKASKKEDFPKLMVSDVGRIVLFTEWGTGVLVKPSKNGAAANDMGEYSMAWVMGCFTDFEGELVLSNK